MRPDLNVSDHNPMVILLRTKSLDDNIQENGGLAGMKCFLRNEDKKVSFRSSVLSIAEALGLEDFRRLPLSEMCHTVEVYPKDACRESPNKHNPMGCVRWWTPELSQQRKKVRHLRRAYQTRHRNRVSRSGTEDGDEDEFEQIKRR